MTLEQISRAIKETYGLSNSDILSGKMKQSDVANVILSVSKNCDAERQRGSLEKQRLDSGRSLAGLEDVEIEGRFYFPDALLDSQNKRNRKAEQKKTVSKLIKIAQDNNLTLYKFRQFIPKTAKDSVYSPRTVDKARTIDKKLFGKTPRIMKLEKAGGRNGDFHLQGLVALPEGEYPIENYERLDYTDIEQGVKEWVAYLSKPADGRLERDMETHKLCNSYEVALLGLADWYTQSIRNRRNLVKRNPKTTWGIQ